MERQLPINHRKPWTSEQIEELQSMVSNTSYDTIAEKLGRTESSINYAAAKLAAEAITTGMSMEDASLKFGAFTQEAFEKVTMPKQPRRPRGGSSGSDSSPSKSKSRQSTREPKPPRRKPPPTAAFLARQEKMAARRESQQEKKQEKIKYIKSRISINDESISIINDKLENRVSRPQLIKLHTQKFNLEFTNQLLVSDLQALGEDVASRPMQECVYSSSDDESD